MCPIRLTVAVALSLACSCLAQEFEVGLASGYGLYHNTVVINSGQSADAGYHSGFAVGCIFGDNMYEYLGGELRYVFQWGRPELKFQGVRSDIPGYSNLLVYDLVVHFKPREAQIRPYASMGAGIKIYTSTSTISVQQPLEQFATLAPRTQVEPAISVGTGVKYAVKSHMLLRADFRMFATPLPNDLF
jgi:OmpA-like transmembrane domain